MKKLIHISPKIWFIIGTIFFLFIAFIIFSLSFKIETVIHTKVKTKGTTTSLFLNSEDAYKVRIHNQINLRINNKTFSAEIKEIIYDKTINLYQLKLIGLNTTLLPNSTIDSSIILSEHSVMSYLFGGV